MANEKLIKQITPKGYDEHKAYASEKQLERYVLLRNETVKSMFVFEYPEYAKDMYPEVFV